MPTKIEWAQESWNPVTGCSKVSAGCKNCYAERMAHRLAGRHGYPPAPNHFDVTLRPERLEQPLKWRKPRTVFVCSMGDLFHKDVPDDFICDVIYTISQLPQHTFIILTKRAKRMREWFNRPEAQTSKWHKPLANLIGMVTVENQDQMWRVDELLKCPFAVRGVSIEPMLGAVELLDNYFLGVHREARTVTEFDGDRVWYKRPGRGIVRHDGPRLGWVIAGGESGPGARPAHPDWFRSLRDQCQAANIPFFFKQWGAWAWPGYAWSKTDWQHPEAREINDAGPPRRLGKKAAGRLLDGREWNEREVRE